MELCLLHFDLHGGILSLAEVLIHVGWGQEARQQRTAVSSPG